MRRERERSNKSVDRIPKETEVARVRIPAARNYELVQKSDKVDAPGFVDFVSVLAYRFCPNLPPAFTQPKALILANLYDRILSIICKPRSRLACQKIFCIKQRFLPVRTVHPVFFIKGLPRLPLKAIIMRVSSREEQLARIAMFARASILSDAKSRGTFLCGPSLVLGIIYSARMN